MSNRAWVTLATNDSYGLGALVLAHSLRRAGSTYPAVVLITPSVTEAMRDRLRAVFADVVIVDVLDSRDAAHLALLQRPELGITFTKIHCWNLTQYEKCVFVDADTLVIQNCDELFEREQLSAAPDVGWPDCFNSGVFVFTPSTETFDQLIAFAQERGSFDGGDQGLLNSFFSDWAHGDINKHLPFLYNVTSAAFYSYLPALKHFGQNLKIIHFIGAAKPWLQQFNWESRTVEAPEHLRELLQMWWDLFVGQVHSQLDTSMSGVAGNLARVVPGAPSQREALDELTRRQGWEAGNIDYMGADSFENIWAKISQTLNQPRSSPPKQSSPPSESIQPEPALKQVDEIVQEAISGAIEGAKELASEEAVSSAAVPAPVEEPAPVVAPVPADSPAVIVPSPIEAPSPVNALAPVEAHVEVPASVEAPVPVEVLASVEAPVPVEVLASVKAPSPAAAPLDVPVANEPAKAPVPVPHDVEPVKVPAPVPDAVEPVKIPAPVPVDTPAPVVESPAVVKPAPVVESVPVVDSAPAVVSAPAVESSPAVEPPPVVESLPVDIPAPVEAPSESVPAPTPEVPIELKTETPVAPQAIEAPTIVESQKEVAPDVIDSSKAAEPTLVTPASPVPATEVSTSPAAPEVTPQKSDATVSPAVTDSPPLANTPSKEEAPAVPAAKSEERRKPAGKLQLKPPAVADPLPTPDSELEDAATLAQSIIASELRAPTVSSLSTPAAPASPSQPAQQKRLDVEKPQVPTPPVGAVSLAQIGVKPKSTTAARIESSVSEKTEPASPATPTSRSEPTPQVDAPKKKVVKKVVKKEGASGAEAPVPPPRKKEKKPKEK